MKAEGKKFISPGGWFSLIYPNNWYEFEDMENSFLFYNPEKWNGNFRISAYKADMKMPGAETYAKDVLQEELKENTKAYMKKVGNWDCIYSKIIFQEEEFEYTTYLWITGQKNMVLKCSFTVRKGEDIKPAEEIIASLEIREESKCYGKEIIPVRIVEIGRINEAFEWTSSLVKKLLKKDFTGEEGDLDKIQLVIEKGNFKPQQREVWESFGITLGVILVNEIDGMEWVTVIDDGKEYPGLRYRETGFTIIPGQLVWEYVRSGKKFDTTVEFDKIKKEIEKIL